MKLVKVLFCCACGKVKDEIPPEAGKDLWVDIRGYLMKYGFRHTDLSLHSTYCSKCAEFYRIVGREGPH